MYEGADVVKDMSISRAKKSSPADEVGTNGSAALSSSAKSLDEWSVKKNNSIYEKYWGTTDMQNISTAAAEALTGSEKTPKK